MSWSYSRPGRWRHTGRLRQRDNLLTVSEGRVGRGGGRRAESYDRKEAWPSINHSLFSDTYTIAHTESDKDSSEIFLRLLAFFMDGSFSLTFTHKMSTSLIEHLYLAVVAGVAARGADVVTGIAAASFARAAASAADNVRAGALPFRRLAQVLA
jgi:hypothetical protein